MDARADLFRGVSDSDLLRAHRLFVAEGRLVVRRVIADSRYRVHSVLVNDAARRELAFVLHQLPAEVPVLVTPTAEFRDLTGYNIHRGCLALVHRPAGWSIQDVLAQPGPLLVLERVGNADNVGGIFRNAAAFGAGGVVLDEMSCDPLYRKALRTSMGAALGVPYARMQDWGQVFTELRAAGCRTAAMTPRRPSIPLDEFAADARGRKIALVFGAEGEGLSKTTLANVDVRVSIPMADGFDSLNVAVAAGVALYALRKNARLKPRAPV